MRRTRKVCFAGTHRVMSPEETLRRVAAVFPAVGITRLADITWLDEIGIPVCQAVRPNSRSLSVSQGKGLTADLAKVSAAMESIEMWHAERVRPGDRVATVAEMEAECGYQLTELSLVSRNYLNPAVELEWTSAARLDGGVDTFVPTTLLRLDGRVAPRWAPPLFNVSTTGLASGNTRMEATLHALYEVIERDAMVRAATATVRQVLLTDSVDGIARQLLSTLATANVDVHIEVMPSPTGLACFQAKIWSEAFPSLFGGAGCHLDRDVALCRALTEAVQSRLTGIAGTRDDLTSGRYRRLGDAIAGRATRPDFARRSDILGQRWDEIESVEHGDLTDDLHAVLTRVMDQTGRSPLMVDHTRADIGIPVVHVICPGLQFDPALT